MEQVKLLREAVHDVRDDPNFVSIVFQNYIYLCVHFSLIPQFAEENARPVQHHNHRDIYKYITLEG